MRKVLRLAAGAVLAGGVLFVALLTWVWHVSRDDPRPAADAIVVLGAAHYNGRPSPVLKARVDHALDLYHFARAPIIVVTGGTHPGDTESEADVQRRYLMAAGVPAESVISIPEGESTEASMTALGRWARERGTGSVLLVSDGFHLARLRLEARRIGLTAATSPVPNSPIRTGSNREFGYLVVEALKLPVAWARSLR